MTLERGIPAKTTGLFYYRQGASIVSKWEARPSLLPRLATRVIARLGIIGAGAIAGTSTICDRQGRQPYKANGARCHSNGEKKRALTISVFP